MQYKNTVATISFLFLIRQTAFFAGHSVYEMHTREYVVKGQMICGLHEIGKWQVESPQSSITRQKGYKIGSVELGGN